MTNGPSQPSRHLPPESVTVPHAEGEAVPAPAARRPLSRGGSCETGAGAPTPACGPTAPSAVTTQDNVETRWEARGWPLTRWG